MKKLFNHITRRDLLIHFMCGYFIYVISTLFFQNSAALILTLVLGIGKEVVWDYYMKKGTPEVIDLVYTIVPALLMFLLF